MEAVVIGATGASGSALIEQLLHNKHYTKVTALLRKATFDDHPKLNQVVVDFDHLENYRDYIKGDVAFSCMGTTAKTAGSKEAQWIVDHDYQYNFAKLAKENGIPHFVLLSSKGADPNSSFFYLKMKGTLDKEVLDLDFEKLFILRPGMLIRPKTNRRTERFAVNFLKVFNNLGLFMKYKPIDVKFVANSMITCLDKYDHKLNILNNDEIMKF